MELQEYRFDEISNNYDKKRVPLSSTQRAKRKGNYRYYGAQGVIDYIDDYIFDGMFVLIAEDGENLKSKKQNIARVVNGQFWVNNHAHIVTGNDLCDTRYLCYLINSMDLSGYVTGSAQPKLSQANLNAVTLTLPPIEVQKKIVDYLNKIDEKIELNTRINKNLAQQAQELFKAWFVTFEFFGGEMPSSWDITRLGDIAAIKTNSFSPTKNPTVMLEHYSIPAFDEQKYPVFELASNVKSNKYILTDNSVMISKLNPDTKRVWRPMCISEFAVSSTEFIIFESNNPTYKDFVFSVIDSAAFSDWMCAHTTGSTNSRQRTTPSTTLEFQIALPNQEVISDFCKIVTPMYDMIAQNTCENRKLAILRDSLLPKLMSGKVDVSTLKP